jgi:predicted dehydrogenase
MSSPFRIACIGIDHPHGAGWRELLPHIGVPVEITAIMPAFGGMVASLEEKYAAVPRYPTVDRLIDEGEFDGAIVCLPNRETPGVVQALAEAGKHILMEKPGGASAADFAPAAEALRKSGVAFQTGFMWRYDLAAERVRAMIADGRFGTLISIEIG